MPTRLRALPPGTSRLGPRPSAWWCTGRVGVVEAELVGWPISRHPWAAPGAVRVLATSAGCWLPTWELRSRLRCQRAVRAWPGVRLQPARTRAPLGTLVPLLCSECMWPPTVEARVLVLQQLSRDVLGEVVEVRPQPEARRVRTLLQLEVSLVVVPQPLRRPPLRVEDTQ